jgi:hypothetical protein
MLFTDPPKEEIQSLQIVSISSLIESSMAVFIKLNRYYASQESYSKQLIRCFDHCLIDNQYRMLEGLVGILLSYKTSFNEISGEKVITRKPYIYSKREVEQSGEIVYGIS